MNNWQRLGLAVVVGAAVGVISALIGDMFNVSGAAVGGAAGGISAAVIATTLRPKQQS